MFQKAGRSKPLSDFPLQATPAGIFSQFLRGNYKLPGDISSDLYVIPVSGGADSAVLAILMHALFPEVLFHMVFTDTLADPEDIYVTLDRLELYVGRPISRVRPEMGLYEMIEAFNGFLPSSNARWCTRELKLKPFEQFIGSIRSPGQEVYTFVGIRADETQRVGLMSHEGYIHTEMPFRDLGVGRQQVFGILESTIGVPALYRHRTRSGCSCCPFQRRSELVGMLQSSPNEFAGGQRYEKLGEDDARRFGEVARSISAETGLSRNHLGFPLPSRLAGKTRDTAMPVTWGKVRQNSGTLFDPEPKRALWVGAEFFVHPGIGGNGVWWQSLVSYSTTRNGLERQLQSHYEHRLQTPEVYGLTAEDMKAELKLSMYLMELPASLVSTDKPDASSYTWTQGESYARIRHLVSWIMRTLQVFELRQRMFNYAGATSGSWREEQATADAAALDRITEIVGEVIQMDLYDPSEPKDDVLDERFIACFHCSI